MTGLTGLSLLPASDLRSEVLKVDQHFAIPQLRTFLIEQYTYAK